ncbi:MAG TPA: YHS domain-containing (seleno)protein [Xanthobacteraceae bacterium]|nr:YHS domain-containing (seleno)protein [Xanthobacteraceae bacterium]
MPPAAPAAGRVMICIGLAAALVFALAPAPRAGIATTERVVTDPLTGLAIDGIDPVAYFVDAAPLSGRPEHELRYAGVVWRFRNEGNAAAFAANPDIYMPRYGGYDPIAIVRSVAVPGNPLLWVRWEDRLYLFHTEDARARFLAAPQEAIEQADIAWPGVLGGLMP